MIQLPPYNKKRNGVPVLSAEELEQIGEALVNDFCPEVLSQPQEVDIDAFAEIYMGLNQDIQYLSHNGIYLGMMVFNDTDRLPVYDPIAHEAKYVSESADTVVIDKTLLDDEKHIHRYRFTMAHEAAGHAVLHKSYYRRNYNPDQLSLFDSPDEPWVQCRKDMAEIPIRKTKTDIDWMELQANTLGSIVLMPSASVKKLMAPYEAKLNKSTEAQCTVLHNEMIEKVSEVFNVSRQAALIRLKKLGFVDKNVDDPGEVIRCLRILATRFF